MIQGINNKQYPVYTLNKREDIQIPASMSLAPSYKINEEVKDASYDPKTYSQKALQSHTQKTDWEQFIKEIEEKEEAYGMAMKSGYMLDNKEWSYLDQFEKSSQGRKVEETPSHKTAAQKIDRIQERHDSMYYYGVQHQGTITMNDLYKWSFGGDIKTNKTQYSNNQLGSLLGMNGLDSNSANMQATRKLMSMGLEVSQSTVTKIQNLETAVEGLDQYKESQEALEETMPLMEDEKILYTDKAIQDIVDELSQVDDETIGQVLGEGKEVTIGNLREVLHRNTEKALGKDQKQRQQQDVAPQEAMNEVPEQGVEDIKSKVNDIRAKLSVEAAQKISEKMPVESTELSKLASELTHVQEAKVVQTLEAVQLEPTAENKEKLTQTLDAVMTIGRQKALALEEQVLNEEVTLEQIHQVAKAYEEQALEPEKRFGETIAKVESQIEAFLATQEIEVSPEVVEGSKALLATDIPLTKENLEQVVPMVEQMNTFLEEMTPHRAAMLIKEGINPYKASVGKLMEWIAVERLPELKDSLGEAILALQEKGKINDNQKQSLLGFYRILNGVEANKFQVAGYLYKNQLPLTVEKLQEAISYSQQKEHIKAQIDDQFGELESVSYARKTSRMMLEEAQTEQDELLDYVKILENLEIPLGGADDPKDYSRISQKIYPFVKQYLKEHLDEFEGIDVLPESFKEKLESLKHIQPEVVKNLEKHHVPVTLSNMYWMQKLVKEPDLYEKFMQQEARGERQFPKNFEEIERFIKEEIEYAGGAKYQAMSEGDMVGYRNYKQLEEMLGLQKELMDKEGLYHIPFVISGEQKMVQLYIKQNKKNGKDDKDSMNVAISYETKHLGKVNAYLKIKDKQLSYEVYGESTQATKALRDQDQKLTQMIEKLGYMLLEGSYREDAKQPTVVEPMPRRSDSQFEVVV